MGPIRNPRWEQKRTEGYVIVSRRSSTDVPFFFFFLITDCIALIAVNNLLDIQLLPSIPSC